MFKGINLTFMVMVIFCSIASSSFGFAVSVHREITKNSATNKSSLLNEKIKDAGFSNGIKELFNGKDAIELLQDGSQKEDEPLLSFRYLNHFYNPLNDSGLGYSYSSYDWANYNDMSWLTARYAYFYGLTSETEEGRKILLATSFQALGQVMHLVQDLAVPAHVRNDAHPIYEGFEVYTKTHIGGLNYTAKDFANALTSVSPSAPRQFWDSDTYTATSNPPSEDDLSVGLSEYTNANFFSDDTIFSSSFPNPAKNDTNAAIVEVMAEDGLTCRRINV